MSAPFKLTYASMFNPPEAMHQRFEQALVRVKAALGRDHLLHIAGGQRETGDWLESRSPINRDWLLGRFASGGAGEAVAAVAAARAAFPGWAATPWTERVRLLRRAGTLIEERVFELAAAVALEVGKNRMEALGEVQETADLIYWYCDQMEQNNGYVKELPDDPVPAGMSPAPPRVRNRTLLKPHGVWAVIAPFNFPFALAGGPLGAALVAGNTVVFKLASDTPWSGWLLAEVFADAGLPPGVLTYVVGGGATLGEALLSQPDLAGVTFTGSYEVGMQLYRRFAQAPWPRPCITEMGGKNAAIVSRHADLERAALGIMRSAFGMSGQKCSACSRVLVEKPVAAALQARLVELTEAITVGDPTTRGNWMGPVINAAALERYRKCTDQLGRHGRVFSGARALTEGELSKGLFCAPTVAAAPFDFRLWREEKFIPLVLLGEIDSVEEGIARANASEYGLTTGFYGAENEIPGFLDAIEAGVTYVNRPQGATTGAWPGYQPFGGWKASGSTGKAIGSFWYLPQYLREQSQTIVE